MATQESLVIWAAAWRQTAADWRAEEAFESRAAKCPNLPRRIRQQAATAAAKARASAADCEGYAIAGTRY